LTADLTSHTSTTSSPVTLTVTSPPVTPTPTPTTTSSLYYAVAIGVVVVVAVVAAVLALGRKGKKGPAQREILSLFFFTIIFLLHDLDYLSGFLHLFRKSRFDEAFL